MAESHRDKVAVISGAARGIGQAFAERLAHDGAHIVIADVLPATDTTKLVQESGRRALVSNCDVSSDSSVNALAAEVTARFGRCDILINCARIYPRQPFSEMTFADWRRMQAINLDSVFLMCAAFVPGMRARKWGRIVNLASASLGTVVSGFVHYAASKGGIGRLKSSRNNYVDGICCCKVGCPLVYDLQVSSCTLRWLVVDLDISIGSHVPPERL